MAKGVVNTDRMTGTDTNAALVSFKYMGAGSTATAIENGCVVKLDGLVSGEKEIFKGVTPAASTDLEDLVVVAGVEKFYDGLTHNLDEFENAAGAVVRGYRLKSGDVFSVTGDCITGTPKVNSIIEAQAGVKLKAVNTLTSGSTQIGTIIDVYTMNGLTFYGILVK